MAVEDDDKEEGEVDLRVELINALEELRKEINKNKSLKAELKMKEGSHNSNSEELEKMIMSLKIQIQEHKIIEEILRSQLEEKEKMIGSLEEKVISLRNDLQKKDMQKKSTRILDQIISIQRSSDDRSVIGYNQV
jgi:chromosome segregation ATPase